MQSKIKVPHIEELKFNNHATWINISKPGKKQIEWLGKKYRFDKLDLKECVPVNQRPKLADYAEYNFMILQFPVYNRLTGEIDSSEIDFFIGPDYLITVHDNTLEPIINLFSHYKNIIHRKELDNVPTLLYEILNNLLHYCFPMLNHINQDIDAIETHIFHIDKKENISTIKEIMRIKRNIVNFRKIMQAHKSIIQKLIAKSEKHFTTHKLRIYYSNLINHTKDIWDFLSNYKDTIDALHETHESLISQRLNEIIKTLTIFSVIVFPLTLFAAIFGMNTMNSMPFIDSDYDFWYIAGIMLIGMIIMIFFFKKKKWM